MRLLAFMGAGVLFYSLGMKIDPQAKHGMRECPGCAMEVPANENRCPICGYEFPGRGPLHRNLVWIVLLMLALLLIPLFLSLR
ncbi:MAG TPA: zinc ribbon domain-containing protein [Kiritimatiellia bacterium]|jgi:rRNA maturation endonuclease Nob1|nr:zinc ribbon domain-containing protein [Kiritimatiellia bacterium]HPC20512.1 zinc ribbon domain-containing protein [Kiritimatiellia bacterium]